ncbi:MAG: hypothetical protein KC488_00470 [Candidatus Cloacimonetes bacterium]|nr:hypothetical protein [Candidatus Cloacimonadota bacterium]
MIEPSCPPGISEDQQRAIQKFARDIVRRRLSAAAIFMLESTTPMNFVISQGMVFLSPLVKIVFEGGTFDSVREMLEKRETIPYIVDLIEFFEYQQREGA